MLFDQRTIFSDNGVLSDISVSLNDYKASSSTLPWVAAEDALYIGSLFPWNNKWVEVSTVNSLASVASVSVWDGLAWQATYDVLDMTSSSGKSLAQSGFIRFTPSRDRAWVRAYESDLVTGLSGTVIYDMYWLKITMSADLTPATALKFIGNKFSQDADLFSYYPDLNNTTLMAKFKVGQADWKDQSFIAAEMVIRDLKSRNIILSREQVLTPELFMEAAVHKTAEIIYAAFGSAFKDDKDNARKRYDEAMKLSTYNIDVTRDGRLDVGETLVKTGVLHR